MIINKEAFLKYLSEKPYPLSLKDLMRHFHIFRKHRRKFIGFLETLEKEGSVVKIKGDKYGLTSSMSLLTGILHGHPNGFGFVKVEDDEEDVYINNLNMNGAMHGDKVVVRLEKQVTVSGEKKEGEIIRILNRANDIVVGNFEENKFFGFVVPDNRKVWHHIYVPKNLSSGAKTNQKVVVKITEWPVKGRNPEGRIVEILGFKNEAGMSMKSLLKQYNLPEGFPDTVIHEAEEIERTIPVNEINSRKDLRNENIFTVDGADAKDFDDAVSIKKFKNGNYELGVHIADVSYYVKEESAVNREALKRGNSIYLLNRVIPMLPEILSNEMCSLKPEEDRLAVSVIMKIDNEGNISDSDIYKSIINSKRRLTYDVVSKIIEEKDKNLRQEYSDVKYELDCMFELARILNNRRVSEGSIDFDLPESTVLLDKKDMPLRILNLKRNWAHRLIEEFMLITNEVVAKHVFEAGLNSIYRIHEIPKLDDLMEFSRFVNTLGYNFKVSRELVSRSLQNLLKKCKGMPEESVINKLALRSLRLAVYSTEPKGHFALAKKFYSHFTSPIRRYPDLAVHRILKNLIEKKSKTHINVGKLSYIAKHCSETERIAEDIEDEITKTMKLQYIRNYAGRVFNGIISGVQPYGLFVEIDELLIEGLVHVSSISDDYYIYDEKKYSLIGRNKKVIYRLGDAIKVKIIKIDTDKKQVDFKICKHVLQ